MRAGDVHRLRRDPAMGITHARGKRLEVHGTEQVVKLYRVEDRIQRNTPFFGAGWPGGSKLPRQRVDGAGQVFKGLTRAAGKCTGRDPQGQQAGQQSGPDHHFPSRKGQ